MNLKMKEFMDKDFLLETDTAKELFEYASKMPIFDYHCHLNPAEIAQNKHFSNITELWIQGDHYKWRAMRSYGIDEYYITGDATDYEKFIKWAEVMPNLIGNPLYHWTHLELQRFFNIYEPLSPLTANDIWKKANSVINSEDFCVFNIFKKFKVECVCTTDDPADSLEYHIAIAQNPQCKTVVLPTFRPDRAININKPDFKEYIVKLSIACNKVITNFQDLKNALEERLLFFKSVGARVADHGIDDPFFEKCTDEEAQLIFKKALNDEKLTQTEINKFKTALTVFLGKKYADYGFAMQIHINVIRNNNERMFNALGADTGFDSINDATVAKEISGLMNEMAKTSQLPKTILYSLNPKDTYTFGTMLGNFQGDGIKGKIQLGSGWWFCDQKDGMESQLKALGNLGCLTAFVGMLTDSRSFLSYTRHEYFRRILCNLIGNWVENGEYPRTMNFLQKVVEDISFNNAKAYFEV